MKETARLVQQSVAAGDYKMPKRFQTGIPEPWEL
jgi:hypothetical protein